MRGIEFSYPGIEISNFLREFKENICIIPRPLQVKKGNAMNQETSRVIAKIHEYHPEIERNNIKLSVSWDEAGKRYALKLSKSGETVGSYLDRKDADDCLAGKKCVNLAVQVTQLSAELEDLLTPRKPG